MNIIRISFRIPIVDEKLRNLIKYIEPDPSRRRRGAANGDGTVRPRTM